MHSRKRGLLWMSAAIGVIVAVLLVWRITPLARYTHPRELVDALGHYATSPWAPLAAVALFVAGGLVSFPLLVLITACALVFHPLEAFCIALVGATASAVVTYLVASRLLNARVREIFGPRIDKVSGLLQEQGILAIAAVRMLPIGPFTLINLAAGSIGLRMRDYILGTMLGLAPGTAAITAFGAQLRSLLDHPTVGRIAVLLAIVVAWILASFALQRFVSRRKRRGV